MTDRWQPREFVARARPEVLTSAPSAYDRGELEALLGQAAAEAGRNKMLITTTPGIEGRPVTEYLGVVTAQGVLGVNAFKDVGAGMRNIFGGRAKSYENELASGVSDALAEMEQQAAQLGADAVVGVDIDYETVRNNMLMVSASGTAVKLG